MNAIFHFDSCYQQQNLSALLPSAAEFDFTEMYGVRGYCDTVSADLLRRQLTYVSPSGIHFLGSGNYHYMSLFFLEKISVPYSLVVFDHHTDMQPSMFGDLLSCGSWILQALQVCAQIKEVLIIGIGEESLKAAKETTLTTEHFSINIESQKLLHCHYQKVPITFIKENAELKTIYSFLSDKRFSSVFLSIDKDVLSPEEVTTDWDQGCMTLSDLSASCHHLSQSCRILGIDICGEPDKDKDIQKSLHVNQTLLQLFSKTFR